MHLPADRRPWVSVALARRTTSCEQKGDSRGVPEECQEFSKSKFGCDALLAMKPGLASFLDQFAHGPALHIRPVPDAFTKSIGQRRPTVLRLANVGLEGVDAAGRLGTP